MEEFLNNDKRSIILKIANLLKFRPETPKVKMNMFKTNQRFAKNKQKNMKLNTMEDINSKDTIGMII